MWEERNRLTLVQKEESCLWKSTCLPLPPPVVRSEDRDKPYTGPFLVSNRLELSWPFCLCGCD